MMIRMLAATATLATALAVSSGAQAGSYGYVYPAPAPVIVHAPVVGPLYFKRDFHGAQLVVKQCRQHRVLDSWGNIAYQEHCQ